MLTARSARSVEAMLIGEGVQSARDAAREKTALDMADILTEQAEIASRASSHRSLVQTLAPESDAIPSTSLATNRVLGAAPGQNPAGQMTETAAEGRPMIVAAEDSVEHPPHVSIDS